MAWSDYKERDAVCTLLSLNRRAAMTSPAPSDTSISSGSTMSVDSGVASGEDSMEAPPNGGIMKKLAHKNLIPHFSRASNNTTANEEDISISKTAISIVSALLHGLHLKP